MTTLRCPEALERLWGALDGSPIAAVAARIGLPEPEVTRALARLAEAGAIEWRRHPAPGSLV